jgi:hypothetical protein
LRSEVTKFREAEKAKVKSKCFNDGLSPDAFSTCTTCADIPLHGMTSILDPRERIGTRPQDTIVHCAEYELMINLRFGSYQSPNINLNPMIIPPGCIIFST